VTSRLYTPPVIAAPTAFALSSTLGDHMTLQRDVPATVWGYAASGTSVKTTFAGNSYTTSAGSDGIWRQALPATAANKVGQTISFAASTGEAAALNDVVFGDVYICSCAGPWRRCVARPGGAA
jgi:sialate O-acetylesterase